MSDASPLRRFPLLMVTLLVFGGCMTSNTRHPASDQNQAQVPVAKVTESTQLTRRCAPDTHQHPYKPIVCIDDRMSELVPIPEPVHASNKQKGGGAVVITFIAMSGDDLTIIPRRGNGDLECVAPDTLNCGGPHCVAIINRDAVNDLQPHNNCKYDIRVDKHPVKDPVIIVDTCCPPVDIEGVAP